jgi:hypothetical protein
LLAVVVVAAVATVALVKLSPPTADGARTIKGDDKPATGTATARDRTMQSGSLSLGPQIGRLEETG